MTYRTARGLRRQPLLAASLGEAVNRAFDLLQALAGDDDVRGFGVRRIGAAA